MPNHLMSPAPTMSTASVEVFSPMQRCPAAEICTGTQSLSLTADLNRRPYAARMQRPSPAPARKRSRALAPSVRPARSAIRPNSCPYVSSDPIQPPYSTGGAAITRIRKARLQLRLHARTFAASTPAESTSIWPRRPPLSDRTLRQGCDTKL